MNLKVLLGLDDATIKKTKLHLAIGEKDKNEPLYEMYADTFKEWQESQTKRNFEREYILSLIYFGKDEWLFAGIYTQHGCISATNGFKYDTLLTDKASSLISRLVIGYKKRFRNSYPYLEKCIDQFELIEIRKEPYTFQHFPGYENVMLKYDVLKAITNNEELSWKTALSNVKGVYLIADLFSGKLYVGSAYGTDAFWTRWQEYVKNGHGGNKLLKQIIQQNGIDYASNFQYSILETRSMNAEDSEIIQRESHWKEVLLTRTFGYNDN